MFKSIKPGIISQPLLMVVPCLGQTMLQVCAFLSYRQGTSVLLQEVTKRTLVDEVRVCIFGVALYRLWMAFTHVRKNTHQRSIAVLNHFFVVLQSPKGILGRMLRNEIFLTTK